jgi:hypothetical protein
MSSSIPKDALHALCRGVVWDLASRSEGDAAATADWLIDQVIQRLRHAPGFPSLTYDAWTLLLADLREEAQHALVPEAIDPDELADAIIRDAEEDEMRMETAEEAAS